MNTLSLLRELTTKIADLAERRDSEPPSSLTLMITTVSLATSIWESTGSTLSLRTITTVESDFERNRTCAFIMDDE